MADFVEAARLDEIPPGAGTCVTVNGNAVALFNVDGAYHAIDNTCPHRGGPIGDGDLEGRVAICPWHGWRWDVTTGANVNNPAVRVPAFPVSAEDGALLVELP